VSRGIAAMLGLTVGVALTVAVAPIVDAQGGGRAWLALGDSYASGEGIPGTNDVESAETHQGRDCRRATGEGTDANFYAGPVGPVVSASISLASTSRVESL